MDTSHTHNWALAALVKVDGRTKAEIARDAEMSPQHLGDLIAGRRAGHSPDVRARLSSALRVDPRAVTCWCDDRQGNHGGAR